MKMSITGAAELTRYIADQKKESDKRIQNVIRMTAFAIEGDAIKSIQRGSKTGIVYNRGGIRHQASAPGEAPASDNGRLAASIKSIINHHEAYVGSDLDYAEWLEYGTMDMAERPWLRPAVEKNIKMFFSRMTIAIRGTE